MGAVVDGTTDVNDGVVLVTDVEVDVDGATGCVAPPTTCDALPVPQAANVTAAIADRAYEVPLRFVIDTALPVLSVLLELWR